VSSRLIWASASLAIALAACGGSSTPATAGPASTCVNASTAHRAYVVVEHLSGKSLQKCVGFNGDSVDGQTLMDQSGIEYQTQTFSFGKGVCQVDNEPKQFSECLPKNQPYWSEWVETGGRWAMAQVGYTQVQVHDKEALGWHYVSSTDQSPSPPPLAKASSTST
jgi:hypothetical protein